MCVCVSTCTRGRVVGQTKQNRQSAGALQHTPLGSCALSEEHVGRISKRTADSSEEEVKKGTTGAHNVPAGLPFARLTFPPHQGARSMWVVPLDVDAPQRSLSTGQRFPVMHFRAPLP